MVRRIVFTPRHFAFGPKGSDRADSPCGINGMWHRGVGYTRNREEVTCRNCIRSLARIDREKAAIGAKDVTPAEVPMPEPDDLTEYDRRVLRVLHDEWMTARSVQATSGVWNVAGPLRRLRHRGLVTYRGPDGIAGVLSRRRGEWATTDAGEALLREWGL